MPNRRSFRRAPALAALTVTLLLATALLSWMYLSVRASPPAGQTLDSLPAPASVAVSTGYTLALPYVTNQIPPVAALRRVDDNGGKQPLNGAIVSGQAMTVEIELLAALTGVQVFLTPGGGSAQDVTGQFAGLEANGTATAVLVLTTGDSRVVVEGTLAGQLRSEIAGILVYAAQYPATLSPIHNPIVTSADIPIPHEARTVLLLFERNVSLSRITEVLGRYGLIPLDVNLLLGMVRAEIPDGGASVEQMTNLLNGDPGIVSAIPNLQFQPDPAAGERMPARLTGSYQTSAGDGCTGAGQREGCFDYSGDRTDELVNFRYHFFLDTFAGQRLVQALVPGRRISTTIGILDSGFTIAGANPLDVPLADFVRPTLVGAATGFNNAGVALGPGGAPVNLNLAAIPDTNLFHGAGHGTSVTAAAAGRGTTNLGTGLDILVRPVKFDYLGDSTLNALSMLALDTDVVAVNASFSTPVDANGDRIVNALDTAWWNWSPGFGQPTRIQSVQQFYNRIGSVLSQAFGDFGADGIPQTGDAGEGNSTYDAGEPFADTNGNGVYDGPGDGKILVASAGNNGVSLVTWPFAFPALLAPGNVRAANDPLVMAISSSETEDRVRGREQLSAFSNFDTPVSVAAPGGNVLLPERNGVLTPTSGTSFSAPMVTGLAGEMIYLDQHTNVPANRLSPLQIIETIEATADDLGATRAGVNVARPNNAPGNGPDPYFGHGRVNVWKGILAVVNRGVAVESHPQLAATFPSLTAIGEANTRWYGFKIHTPLRGATLWIDGVQVTDAGSTAPGGAAINAYAGVRTDRTIRIGIPGEDPTTGIVPIGSQSDFLITVSIERSDLVKNGGVRTLQLRRPGQSAADAPFFVLALNLQEMRDGKVPGVVFDDFVFEITPPDLGDGLAGPTILADDGARHLNDQFEYFGKANATFSLDAVSPEHAIYDDYDPDGVGNRDRDMVDLDAKDDGVVFYPLTYKPGEKGRVDVQVCVVETGPRYDRNNRDKQLYVNGWIDWNTNLAWQEGTTQEHVLDGLRLAITDTTALAWAPLSSSAEHSATVTLLSSNSDCGRYKVEFNVPAQIGHNRLESRWRLDYGENVGRWANTTFTSSLTLSQTRGAAFYGEVEDYVIGPDFGDAGEDDPWPTKLTSNGPRHLSFYREWIGAYSPITPRASREPDACATAGSDMDGVDNLGNGCDSKNQDALDDFTVEIPRPGIVRIDFDVSSGVQGYGFDGNNGGKTTLAADCSLTPLAATPETPAHQQVEMRYDANNPAERLYVNIFADWDGNGSFETQLLSAPVDPEAFGKDGLYTLGEPFTDTNRDGIWQSGEPFTDVAGTPGKAFSCEFPAPVPPPGDITQWVRIRLDYGENAGQYIRRSDAFEEAPLHVPAKELGGAVWGEVEDTPLTGPKVPEKVSIPTLTVPNDILRYIIYLPISEDLQGEGDAFISDLLPSFLEFVEGSLQCSFAQCEYSPSGHAVSAFSRVLAQEIHHLTFEVRIPTEWGPSGCPPEIVNQAQTFDGVAEKMVEVRTQVTCPGR